MKKMNLLFAIASLCFAVTAMAQPRGGDNDMENYRMRNSNFVPQTGATIGGVPQTGATIGVANRGGGGGISGWTPRDGLGPVVTTHNNSGSSWGNNNNNSNNHYQTHVPGWVPQDGLGPAVVRPHPSWNNNNNNNNSGSSWGNGSNWGNNNNWGNGSSWGNGWNNPTWSSSWGNIGWGGGNVTINNYYNPNSWWRDIRYGPSGGMSQIAWDNNNYYYHDGNFFNIVNGIYQVVLPVLGMILNSLPQGATPLPNYNNYYSYHGVYYYYTGSAYRVAAPPIGACLSSLPYFARATVVNGISCYTYDNIFIQPTYNVDGTFCYRVVGSIQ